MSKKRVYELAKELGLENKELIARLEKIGIAVRSHSSTLDDADLEQLAAIPGVGEKTAAMWLEEAVKMINQETGTGETVNSG